MPLYGLCGFRGNYECMYARCLWIPILLLGVGAAPAKPRAAQSVLLVYHAPPSIAIYNSVKILKSQRGSYFQVCGFSHGYCGLQELANGRHILIFSVWDLAPAKGRKKVPAADRAQVVYLAQNVRAERFGGEGTGDHVLVPFRWHIGRTYHVAIRSWAMAKRTAYGIWLYDSFRHRWVHLATLSTPTERPPGLISGEGSGYYAFIEDFHRDTISAKQVRQAVFGPMWTEGLHGRWRVLHRAVFGSSDARWEARGHISAKVFGDRIRLATGGNTRQNVPAGRVLKLRHIPTKIPIVLRRLPQRAR